MVAGQKFDNDKVRLDLIPTSIIWAIGKILTFGATKYGDRNWEEGILYSRVYGALLRHVTAWWAGEQLDPESGEHHLSHAACCLTFLVHYEQGRYATWDDRPNKEDIWDSKATSHSTGVTYTPST
jgi:hypothetical protein